MSRVERPDVRGQVLAQPDGLGALSVGVAGQDGVAVALGAVEQRTGQAAEAGGELVGRRP